VNTKQANSKQYFIDWGDMLTTSKPKHFSPGKPYDHNVDEKQAALVMTIELLCEKTHCKIGYFARDFIPDFNRITVN